MPLDVNSIPAKYLPCRDYAHAWKLINVDVVRHYLTRKKELHRHFVCLHNCGTNRVQRLTPDGFIIASSYSYPEGYLQPGSGRASAEDRAHLRTLSNTGTWGNEK